MLEIVKKSKEKKVGLEEVKEDLLKVISKVEGLEQKIENLNHKVKRLQQQTGFTMWDYDGIIYNNKRNR